MKTAFFILILSIAGEVHAEPLYIDEYGLQVTVNENGRVRINRQDSKVWKESREGENYLFVAGDAIDPLNSSLTQGSTVHLVKDGRKYQALSERVVRSKDPKFSDFTGLNYEITDASSYLKQCSNSPSNRQLRCELVSTEMCGRIYGETMKLKETDINKCVDLFSVVKQYREKAINSHDEKSSKLLAEKFPRFKPEQKQNTDEISLYSIGHLCRTLRCRQGVPNCGSEAYFPTMDQPVPSARPLPSDGAL